MISALMELALSQRVVVIGAALVLAITGIYSFHELDIEAYPDPVQPMVEVLTQPNGLGAEEVEKLVTVPLEVGLAGMLHLESMRSISLFGLSDVRCYFSWESDYEQDRVQTINRLGFISLPPGVTAGISPENPIGEIYRYTVESPGHDLTREKEIQDWVLEKQLKTVPGVIDVSGFGGLTKEYHVDVDPQKLNHYQVPLATLLSAIANSNTNVGGNYLEVGEQAFNVRGIGFIHSLDDIRDIVLSSSRSMPLKVGNVAEVSVGYASRLGIVGMSDAKRDRDEVVTGIVLMRKYGDTLKTLKGVETKVQSLNTSGILPKGYKVAPYYDRTRLVETTLHTVMENLSIGMLLVFVVLIFFLGSLRAAIIVAINIPLALLGAFILMRTTDMPANLISLGAIDFGIIIDTTVVVIENIYRHLGSGETARGSARSSILRAAQEVGAPILFSRLIFVITFLPLFTMRGVEGAIFSPMSYTYAFAIGAAFLLSVTLSPVLSSFLLDGVSHELRNPPWDVIRRFYHWLFLRVLDWPRLTLTFIVAGIIAALALFPTLGGEFLPKLEEGNIWVARHDAADHFPRTRREARLAHASGDDVVSRSYQRCFPARPARQRYGKYGLLQCRVRRRSKAGPGMAGRCYQAGAYPPGRRQTDARFSGRELRLLAEHRGQHQRSPIGCEGNQFGQDLRPRPFCRRGHRQQDNGGDGEGTWYSRHRRVPLPGPAQPAHHSRSLRLLALRIERRRRRGGGSGGDRRAGGHAGS